MQLRGFFGVALALTLVGCITTGQADKDNQIQQLQTRVEELEKEVGDRNEQISYLESELAQSRNPVKEADEEKAGSVKATPKNIQTALKNAGFYDGTVDGKIGKKTRTAIKNFQEANSLKADGVVGKKTWVKLAQHL